VAVEREQERKLWSQAFNGGIRASVGSYTSDQ